MAERRFVLPRDAADVRTFNVAPPARLVSLTTLFVLVLALLIGAVLWALFGRGK